MNEEFPWFLLAMIIIAFLRWIVLKIQGKSATDDFDERHFADEEKDAPARVFNRSDPTVDPNEEIRKFFEMLGGRQQPEEKPKPVKRAPLPPPVPNRPVKPPTRRPVAAAGQPSPYGAAKKAKLAALSPEEQAALKRLHGLGGDPTHRAKAVAGPVSLQRLIGSRDGLKTAVVLKEILDRPKALRLGDEGHGF